MRTTTIVIAIMVISVFCACAPARSGPAAPLTLPATPTTGPRSAPASATATVPLPESITFYDWPDDVPTGILKGFTDEYGVKVDYVTYDSQEEAIANIQKGISYDVVVVENQYIPVLANQKLLAELNYQNIPRAKNISPYFRGRSFDPGDKHSIPMNWGTTGINYRKDLVKEPVTSWNDLWAPQYRGKVSLTTTERDLIGVTLKALGYPVNSEDPRALEAVRERLLQIAPDMLPSQDEDETAELLASGRAVIAMGYGGTALKLQDEQIDIGYVLPKEGTIVWGDNYVIPANSPNHLAAELFLDYMLRPEVSAQMVKENHYATPNQTAVLLLPVALQMNPIMFPSSNSLLNGESILPLSETGRQLYDRIWSEFYESINK